uniref:magnesium chelatase domain-containing protein n=1 Tax=Erythrobacter sp. TaxID=1042 RepID=UPI00311DC852
AMLLAVLESRCGLNFSSAEVYLNIAGGYRLSDPAADLAVAAALVSALADRPLPDRSVWFGEISLAGEIRPVAHASLRLREAEKLGFGMAFGPSDVANGSAKLDYCGTGQVAKLVDRVMANP